MVLTGRNNNGTNRGRVREFFGQDKVKYFIGGMIAAYAIKKFAETDTAHDLAVSATAGFLNLKDSVEETVENIKEDAEDIHTEAQQKQQIEVFGPEDFDDEDEEEDDE